MHAAALCKKATKNNNDKMKKKKNIIIISSSSKSSSSSSVIKSISSIVFSVKIESVLRFQLSGWNLLKNRLLKKNHLILLS